jgi:hypothetical protein
MSRKKRTSDNSQQEMMQDRLAKQVAGGIQAIQEAWVRFMQGLTSRLSRKMTYLLFGVFVVAGFSCCVYLLVALPSRPVLPTGGEPVLELGTDSAGLAWAFRERDKLITRVAYLRIKQVRHVMDSLRQSREGRAQLQLFLDGRPGFADSLRLIEQNLRDRLWELER